MLFLGISSCNFQNKPSSNTVPVNNPVPGGNNSNVSSANSTICSNYQSVPANQMEVATVHEMIERYQNSVTSTEPIALRFDLETLKQFLYHLEMEVRKNGLTNPELGVRIYYAEYPPKNTWNTTSDLNLFLNNSITEQYEEKHTVVMVPTIKNGNVHYDFNPLDINTYNGLSTVTNTNNPYTKIRNPFPRKNPSPSTPNTPGAPTIMATTISQNHGNMYPPYNQAGLYFNY